MSVTITSIRRPDFPDIVDKLRLKYSSSRFGTYSADVTTYPDKTYADLTWDPETDTAFATWANATTALWYKLVWVDTNGNESNPTEPIYGGASTLSTPKDVLVDSLGDLAQDFTDKQFNHCMSMAEADVRVSATASDLSAWEKKWLVYRGLVHAYIILANGWITQIPLTKADRGYQLNVPYKNMMEIIKQLDQVWEDELERVDLVNGRYSQIDNDTLVASYDALWEDLVSRTTGYDWTYYKYEDYINVDDIQGLYNRDQYNS